MTGHDATIEEIRALVAADGGAVAVVAADPALLHLALVLDDDACRECVMPRSFLEQVAADIAARHGHPDTRVVIDDPRED